jgi:predicted DNA-binding transcriptional regulator YafY
MNTKNNNNNIKFTINADNCLPARAAARNLKSSIKNRKCYRGPVFGRRTRVERVCAIDQWLRAKSYPNAQTMRARLGVTDRTILRDIDFMKFERRMPIDFDQSRNGYYYTKPVEALSQPQLSAEGIFSIMLAHKSLAQHPGTPFDKPMHDAFQRLIVQLDNRELESIINLGDAVSFRAFAPEHTDPALLAILTQSLAESRELRFLYRNAGKTKVVPRCIQPYHLLCFNQRWYLIGFDLYQRVPRTYALSRISKPRLQERTFTRPDTFDPNHYFQGTLGVMKGEQSVKHDVVIELDAFGTDLIGSRQLHDTQKLEPLGGNRTRLTLQLSSLDELERELLSWGTHAKVIGPECLRDRLGKITSELAALYSEPANPTTPPPADTNQLTLLE